MAYVIVVEDILSNNTNKIFKGRHILTPSDLLKPAGKNSFSFETIVIQTLLFELHVREGKRRWFHMCPCLCINTGLAESPLSGWKYSKVI
jgi:hypothetical protein